jgi:glutathione S-transferase
LAFQLSGGGVVQLVDGDIKSREVLGWVPVLVHDGAMHIESNDIIAHLERAFPTWRCRRRSGSA